MNTDNDQPQDNTLKRLHVTERTWDRDVMMVCSAFIIIVVVMVVLCFKGQTSCGCCGSTELCGDATLLKEVFSLKKAGMQFLCWPLASCIFRFLPHLSLDARKNLSPDFLTRSDANRYIQLKIVSKRLKFQMKYLNLFYYQRKVHWCQVLIGHFLNSIFLTKH